MARTKEQQRAYYLANRERILARVKARAVAKADEIHARCNLKKGAKVA